MTRKWKMSDAARLEITKQLSVLDSERRLAKQRAMEIALANAEASVAAQRLRVMEAFARGASEGASLVELAEAGGISRTTVYQYRKDYEAMNPGTFARKTAWRAGAPITHTHESGTAPESPDDAVGGSTPVRWEILERRPTGFRTGARNRFLVRDDTGRELLVGADHKGLFARTIPRPANDLERREKIAQGVVFDRVVSVPEEQNWMIAEIEKEYGEQG